jgi:hypothetical protein
MWWWTWAFATAIVEFNIRNAELTSQIIHAINEFNMALYACGPALPHELRPPPRLIPMPICSSHANATQMPLWS